MVMKGGCRITWAYTHFLNSISSVVRVKHGVYYGKIKHTILHWRKPNSVQMVCVQFDGNKRASVIPERDVKLEIMSNKSPK